MNVSLSLLLLGLVATVYGASTARVVNGTNAPDGKYPYMVAISKNGWYHCGGSILNKRYILTAGHCLTYANLADLEVKYGTTLWNDTNVEWQQVEELILHEQYVDYQHNDVGLIKVRKEIVFNEKVQPVNLPTSDNIEGTFLAVFTGWGRLYAGGPAPNDLQQIALNVIPYEECVKIFTASTRHHICTYNQVGEGTCHGDSGGPLVSGNNQIGINSYSRPCSIGYPSVMTRVYSFVDWIEEHSRL